MTKEQAAQAERLFEKYNFSDEISLNMKNAEFMSMMLGIAYELSDEEIAKYMEAGSKTALDIDLARICVLLGPKTIDLVDEIKTLKDLRNVIYDIVEDPESEPKQEVEKSTEESKNEEPETLERYQAVFRKHHISLKEAEEGNILITNLISNDNPYSRLTNVVLNSNSLSPAQLNLVLKAVKEKIPEEYIMRFANPEINAMQMEKAIEIYLFRRETEEKEKAKENSKIKKAKNKFLMVKEKIKNQNRKEQ